MQQISLNERVENSLLDVPVTFVRCEAQQNVHVFIPEAFDLHLITTIAENFSRKVQQPVRVYHDEILRKFRLCPFPEGSTGNAATYGVFQFLCDKTELKKPAESSPCDGLRERNRIPRPRNSWILYRQYFSGELSKIYPGITASELSTLIASQWKNEPAHQKDYWRYLAEQEERNHKKKYPDYKYRVRKPQGKKRKEQHAAATIAGEIN
ncbi:MAT1-1-3 [Trichoderma sp. SZMC 28014]